MSAAHAESLPGRRKRRRIVAGSCLGLQSRAWAAALEKKTLVLTLIWGIFGGLLFGVFNRVSTKVTIRQIISDKENVEIFFYIGENCLGAHAIY